jgi:hypothetical protein
MAQGQEELMTDIFNFIAPVIGGIVFGCCTVVIILYSSAMFNRIKDWWANR